MDVDLDPSGLPKDARPGPRLGWAALLTRFSLATLGFETLTGLAITLAPFHPAVQWSVLVHTALDVPGSRYSQAVFELYSPTDLSLAGAWGASLNTRFGLANVPAGTWLLRVSRVSDDFYSTRWRGQWFDRAGSAAGATPVVVPAGGGITSIDLVLEPGGIIAGVGTGAADDDWRRAVLTRADAATVVATRYVFASTYDFRFTGLEDGTYRLGITPAHASFDGVTPPSGTNWYPGTTDWAAAGDIAIADADSVGGLSLAVP